jgi:hypothetical protein
MFANEPRLCFVDETLFDRSYHDVIRPELFDCDMAHNQTVCAIAESYLVMCQEPQIQRLVKRLQFDKTFELTLKFSTIAEKYKDGLQVLHDNTMESLKEACRTVARQIDEEATFRFGLSPGHPYQNAALKATEKNVFGYNDKARLRRDQQLREDFKLRLRNAHHSKGLGMLEIEKLEIKSTAPKDDPPKAQEMVSPSPEAPVKPSGRARDNKQIHQAPRSAPPRPPNPAVAAAPPAPIEPPVDVLCSKEEAEALKGKVTLSALENVNVPDLNKHEYVRGLRPNEHGFLDYMSEYECHSITRTGEGANVKYTKTTKIPTDSINMADPRQSGAVWSQLPHHRFVHCVVRM